MEINNNFILKQALDSWILVDKRSNNYVIKLNKTSKDIFECVSKNMKTQEIIDYLSKEYSVDKNTLEKDVNDFVTEMIQKEIIIDK